MITDPWLIRYAASKIPGFKVFREPYDLNWICLRSANTRAGMLDDTSVMLWTDDAGGWCMVGHPCSLDPGKSGLKRGGPAGAGGTLILASNRQNIKSHRLGLHKGRPALENDGPIWYGRDGDLDELLEPGPARQGIPKSNYHDDVGVGAEASDGCTVAEKRYVDEDLDRVRIQIARGHGPWVSQTIVDAP